VTFKDSSGKTRTVGAGQSLKIAGNLGQPVSLADPRNMTPEEAQALEALFAQFAENFSWTSPDGADTTTSSGEGAGDGADGGSFGNGGGVSLPTGAASGGGGGGGSGAGPTPVPRPPVIYGE
jgi:hypothetical protein